MFFRSRPWNEVVYWALDLETSSLDPTTGTILSVGMVPIRDGRIRWGDHFYGLVRPADSEMVDTEAIAIHQILPEELREAPDLSFVMREIARRLSNEAALLVHHASLDVGFLRRSFRTSGLTWPDPVVVDTQTLAFRLENRRRLIEPHARPLPYSLSGLRESFDLPPFDSHHALSDALATAEVFLALRARLEARTLRQLKS